MTTLIVKYRDVHLQNAGVTILQDVDLSVQRGEMTYLIGRTGSGKTTLLRSMYADLPIHSGRATIVGEDLVSLEKGDVPFLRRKLGIVFQDFRLLTDRSIFDNLDFVLRATDTNDKKAINNKIAEVLDLVGLPEKANSMPHQLSGGEQQRITIARALLNNPSLILADEPTGHLDPETSESILELLTSLVEKKKTAIFLATHDYTVMDRFPGRIYRCSNQTVSELGSVDMEL